MPAPLFLTLPRLLAGTLYDLFESLGSRPRHIPSCPAAIGEYRLVRPLHEGSVSGSATGLYVGIQGEHVAIRHLRYRYENLAYRSLLHESGVLTLFTRLSRRSATGRHIRFPRPVQFSDTRRQEAVFVKEYVEGRTLDTFDRETRLRIFEECIGFLEEATSRLGTSQTKAFPRRPNAILYLTFPAYLFLACLRRFISLRSAIRLGGYFFAARLPVFGTRYVLSHRDLHPGNIIVNDTEIVLVDNEGLVLAERHTDLSRALRTYHQAIPLDQLKAFLRDGLATSGERQKFFGLSAYCAAQILATCPREREYFGPTSEYVKVFLTEIAPHLVV